ncbi:MAG: hypothetical protein ABEH81_00800 [Halopenitus sp.]
MEFQPSKILGIVKVYGLTGPPEVRILLSAGHDEPIEVLYDEARDELPE